jgi:hypothetical protein
MGSGVTTLLQTNSKKLWPVFPLHIGSYTISNAQHARKEAETLQELTLCLGEPKGHDPHEMEIIMSGLSASPIPISMLSISRKISLREHSLMMKSYTSFLMTLPKRELELEQEEFKKETLNQFQRLLQRE